MPPRAPWLRMHKHDVADVVEHDVCVFRRWWRHDGSIDLIYLYGWSEPVPEGAAGARQRGEPVLTHRCRDGTWLTAYWGEVSQ